MEGALRVAVVRLELSQPEAPQTFGLQRHGGKNAVPSDETDFPYKPSSIIAITDDGSVLLESAIGTIESDHNLVVLLVDDNKVNRNLMGHWLSKRVHSSSSPRWSCMLTPCGRDSISNRHAMVKMPSTFSLVSHRGSLSQSLCFSSYRCLSSDPQFAAVCLRDVVSESPYSSRTKSYSLT